MTESTVSQRTTVTLAGAAVFATLAALLTLSKAAIPFPLIPYLQIDFAEIPILIAFFLFGPVAAAISAVIHWLFLNVMGADAPLGPVLKFTAEISTVAGFWVGNLVYRRVRGTRPHPTFALSVLLGGGVLLRVAAMTLANYIVLLYVAPVFFHADYLAYARMILEQTTHWTFADNVAALVFVLLFTAVYNIINLLVAVVPAGLISSPITTPFKHITSIEAWLTRNIRS